MTTTKRLAADPGKGSIFSLALIFFTVCTWASYAHWANFEYRTFDLAYYVQALWQLIHGRFQASVLGVPLLGNHVEPIIFLIAPLFLVFRHPLVFVFVQNAALASMGPVAFSIGQRLGLDRKTALLLAGAVLITPATGYIALHEFHPEAFTAPFLLLMLHARLRCSLRAHWGWLIAVLACKENMALLIGAYCAVHVVLERKRPLAELRAWYLWPMALSVLWFLVCAKLITSALNTLAVDRRADSSPTPSLLAFFTGITKPADELTEQGLGIKMSWNFQEPHEVFPWMFLKLTPRDHRMGIIISRGLRAPEAANGPYQENWRIPPSTQIPEGDYGVEVFFVDNAKRVWAAKSGQPDAQAPLLSPPVPLGELRVAPGKSKPSRN